MITITNKVEKIEVYDRVESIAYYGEYIEIYFSNIAITRKVKNKDEAMEIFKKYDIKWDY